MSEEAVRTVLTMLADFEARFADTFNIVDVNEEPGIVQVDAPPLSQEALAQEITPEGNAGGAIAAVFLVLGGIGCLSGGYLYRQKWQKLMGMGSDPQLLMTPPPPAAVPTSGPTLVEGTEGTQGKRESVPGKWESVKGASTELSVSGLAGDTPNFNVVCPV